MPLAARRSQVSAARPAAETMARRHRPDYWLLALTVSLIAIGMILLFSISPALSAIQHVSANYYVLKQLVATALGFVAFAITAYLPLDRWRHLAVPLLVIAAGATLLATVLPVNPDYPAHRWVRLGGLSFQSVELVKFALLIWLAGLLAERIRAGVITNVQATLQPVLIVLAVTGLIVAGIQSDLGSMGVIIAMVAAMLFVAGLPLQRLALIVGVVLIGLVLAISAIPYRRERLLTFLHPAQNCQDSGYQACQALIAVGSGGMFGLGLGSSVQAYGYLPEAANDSIFAIYAEKFGFIGSVLLLAVIVALLARVKMIAERVPDEFSRLVVIGVFTWLSVQALINIGAMIGVLPLKGITLPFVSYGGTSVIFVLAAMGLVFQASRYTLLGTRAAAFERREG